MATDWWQYRQAIAADMNGDGVVTVSDCWLWFKWFYFFPGDVIVAGLGPTAVGRFLEMTPGNLGGVASGFISFFAWLMILVWVAQLIEALAHAKRLATDSKYRAEWYARLAEQQRKRAD